MTDQPTRSRRRHLPALALVTAGLLAGSTGGAVAGAMVTGAQIKNGTITSADVKDRSLGTVDLSASAVNALRGRTGPQGAPGLTGLEVVRVTETIPYQVGDIVEASCPEGKVLVSSHGYYAAPYEAPPTIRPLPDMTGVDAYAGNADYEDGLDVTVLLTCAAVDVQLPPR